MIESHNDHLAGRGASNSAESFGGRKGDNSQKGLPPLEGDNRFHHIDDLRSACGDMLDAMTVRYDSQVLRKYTLRWHFPTRKHPTKGRLPL